MLVVFKRVCMASSQLGPRSSTNSTSLLYIAICDRIPSLARHLRYGERRLSQVVSKEHWMPGGGIVEAPRRCQWRCACGRHSFDL
jgi:hypothetical protein